LVLLQDRIEIVEGNISHRPDVILSADVIIMNNVFEFFMEPEQQMSIWRFLRQTIKSGTLLVTIPSLEETFSCLQVSTSIAGNL
jgi:chemotaxis methyl-accepting protein methylase